MNETSLKYTQNAAKIFYLLSDLVSYQWWYTYMEKHPFPLVARNQTRGENILKCYKKK